MQHRTAIRKTKGLQSQQSCQQWKIAAFPAEKNKLWIKISLPISLVKKKLPGCNWYLRLPGGLFWIYHEISVQKEIIKKLAHSDVPSGVWAENSCKCDHLQEMDSTRSPPLPPPPLPHYELPMEKSFRVMALWTCTVAQGPGKLGQFA